MTDAHHHAATDPLAHPEVQQASAAAYISAYVLTVGLLGVGLFMTERHLVTPHSLIPVIAAFAIFLLVAQSLLFLGLDVSHSNIWKTVSLMLTVPLFILSIGLTVWMFHSLDHLVMSPEMPGMSLQPGTLQ